MQKRIDHILTGRVKQITPEKSVRQPLPHAEFRFANPFIVVHHLGPETIAAGSQFRIHPHPRRGFAPELRPAHGEELVRNLRLSLVAIQLQGEGYHKDNAGHDETISAGDVQWMFAGKGIMHSEGPTARLLETGGTQELIQLWINAPAAYKADEPFYQSARKSEQPFVLQQEGVELRLASGEYDGQLGPLKSFTPVVMLSGTIEHGRRVQLTATPGYWTLLYIANGAVSINCESIAAGQLVVFEKGNDEIIITAVEDTQILFLSAEPIEDPVAAKNNFVMNTAAEIQQALDDAREGRFGMLDY